MGQIAEEAEFAATEGSLQAIEKEPAERPRQRLNGQTEVRFAGDPALVVESDASARDETVDMRVMGERLAPGVQHRDQADPGGQALGGERHQRLSRCAHQEGIDRPLVLKGDLGRRRRQGEDDMEIGDRQQFGLPRRKPLRSRRALTFWTMTIAASNGRCPLRALWAHPVMGSWRRLDHALVSSTANPALHYEERLRSAISLSEGRNAPCRRCGGTIDSMASSFSVGSPRV